ncbi:MAG TPA: response regulator [Turneriella sp.]|nr:response regulator [Turneriella sp.]
MEKNERILSLEDDVEYARVLSQALRIFGEVQFTAYPDRFLSLIETFKPTLLISDYNLNHPTLNGIKVTRMVRRDANSNFLPILLLSGEEDMEVIEEAYKSGIDDYVLKPVIPRFLIAKIENLLFQTRKKLNAQALSGLPGNSAIETEFYLRWQSKKAFTAAYTDLDNFKPFNDEKGVKKGDEAIQIVSEILYQLRAETERHRLFVGHIGGDDFFLMGGLTSITSAVKKLHKRFALESRRFFSAPELKSGFYRGTDRQGNFCSFPLLTISTALIKNISYTTLGNFTQLTELAARAKKAAKKSTNKFVIYDVAVLSVPQKVQNLFELQQNKGQKKQQFRRQKLK